MYNFILKTNDDKLIVVTMILLEKKFSLQTRVKGSNLILRECHVLGPWAQKRDSSIYMQ